MYANILIQETAKLLMLKKKKRLIAQPVPEEKFWGGRLSPFAPRHPSIIPTDQPVLGVILEGSWAEKRCFFATGDGRSYKKGD